MQLFLQVIGVDIDTPRDQPLPLQVCTFSVKLVLVNTRNDPVIDADGPGKMPGGRDDLCIGQKMRIHIWSKYLVQLLVRR
jgi:hypothetical protein